MITMETVLQGVLVLSGFLLALYLLALCRDCLSAYFSLSQLLKENASSPPKTNFFLPETSFSRSIQNSLAALRFRLATANWQDGEEAQRISELFDNVPFHTDARKESSITADPLQQILQKIQSLSRAKSVICIHENPQKSIQAFGVGAVDKSLLERLSAAYSSFFTYTEASRLGMLDLVNSAGTYPDLSAYQIRYVIAIDLILPAHGQAILWFGYDEDAPPATTEYAWAQDIARKIQRELSSYVALGELSEQVSQARQEGERRKQFLEQISHDIRSPLTNIRSILDIFYLESKTVGDQELAQTARRNCESMDEIISAVVDYTHHQAGELFASPESFSFNLIVDHVVEAFREAAKRKSLALQVDVPQEIIICHADQRQIKRVVTNLVSNAIKYTREGSVSLSLSQSNDTLVLQVKDSGLGISPHQQARLFQPFQRFHQKEATGIGLGLTVTKALVELNQGSLTVKSQEGEGSTFTLTLPVNRTLHTPPQKELAPATLPILLIDDDIDCLESLGGFLRKQGLIVSTANSFLEAKKLLQRESFHAIVTDGHMPDGKAKDVLRATQNSQQKAVFLVVTGADSASEHAELLQGGVQKVLLKPADPQEILKLLLELPPKDMSLALAA